MILFYGFRSEMLLLLADLMGKLEIASRMCWTLQSHFVSRGKPVLNIWPNVINCTAASLHYFVTSALPWEIARSNVGLVTSSCCSDVSFCYCLHYHFMPLSVLVCSHVTFWVTRWRHRKLVRVWEACLIAHLSFILWLLPGPIFYLRGIICYFLLLFRCAFGRSNLWAMIIR